MVQIKCRCRKCGTEKIISEDQEKQPWCSKCQVDVVPAEIILDKRGLYHEYGKREQGV